MSHIRLTQEFRNDGFSHGELARLSRSESIVRVRRGAYGEPPSHELDARDTHRRLIAGTVPQLGAGAVLSHGSAAVLHGLPVWPDQLTQVHITRSRAGGGRRRRYVHVHGHPLAPGDTVSVDGLLVTSLARTIVDLACGESFARAVAAGDAALRRGLSDRALAVQLERAGRRTGVVAARRVVPFLDRRSESPGESESRAVLHEQGAPRPELQYEVYDRQGGFVARTDFGWPELRTIGEFDGRVKYGRALRTGQDLEEVLFNEKVREDALRDCGWQVVRWTSTDLRQPQALVARLTRAFARGRIR